MRSFHLSSNFQSFRFPSKKKEPGFDRIQAIFSWKSVAFLLVFGGSYVYVIDSFQREKKRKVAESQNKVIGQAALGGEWELTRLDGTKGGSEDLRGNFGLLYFGFTHCPDICPEEIEKAIKVVDATDDNDRLTKKLIPVFITIDPARDTASVLKNYIAEFSPKMIGYVGTPEEIRTASRNFRVYYSKGPEDEDGDYIVDHSIIMYLIGPDGMFIDYYGQNKTAQEMTESITSIMMKEEGVVEEENQEFLAALLSFFRSPLSFFLG